MGQQQLLLVILVTIIVGIATVVAINTFGSAADSANVDAVRNDLTSMAASAQGYYMKPKAMGGGGNDFAGINWNNMGGVAVSETQTDGSDWTNGEVGNENGEYTIGTITAGAGGDFIIEAVPSSGGAIQIRVCPDGAVMGDYAATGTASAPDACPNATPTP